MAGSSTIRNYKRLQDEFLGESSTRTIGGISIAGDKLLVAAIDGQCRILDIAQSDELEIKRIKKIPMTLFLTDRHVVVYQANTGIRRDYALALPYSALKGIAYKVLSVSKKDDSALCNVSFTTKKENSAPSILFSIPVDDIFTYDAIMATLSAASGASGLRIEDNTEKATAVSLGLTKIQ